MPQITIYTTAACSYCRRAKALLAKKNLEFTEIDVDADPAARKTMVQRSGGRTTVPQIFFDGKHVGDCDELHELHYDGKLDRLLVEQTQ